MMLADARPTGIAPPTIPRGLSLLKDVPHGTAQSVVSRKGADFGTHFAARFLCAQPFAMTIKGEVQQVAAFKCVKHFWPSDAACPHSAHRMVNIPLMEGANA